GTRMQSVGEVMGIGRTFPESLQKAVRSLEQGRAGLNADPGEAVFDEVPVPELLVRASKATPERIFEVESLLRRGVSVEQLAEATGIDLWFLDQIALVSAARGGLDELAAAPAGTPAERLERLERSDWRRLEALGAAGTGPRSLDRRAWRAVKRLGFSDAQVAHLLSAPEAEVRAARLATGVRATFKTVDTCGAEFAARTPYHYATYEDEDEVQPSGRPRVVILGSGPNRIGQGIEFDYCCVHASMALRAAGYETVMVNCNPETVSTDYDTSDRLYFEPLTAEDVTNVLEAELAASRGAPVVGVIVGLGGQTPLKLAHALPPELVLGTRPEAIDLAEDREQWNALCERLGIPQPPGGTATTVDDALAVAGKVGYPVLVRPSYVLGGRAMEIVYDDERLAAAVAELGGSLRREGGVSAQRPVLVDRFLEDAVEVDVDAVRDGEGEVLVAGIMEHVEEAGVHSGDSACALPPQTLPAAVVERLDAHTRAIAHALEVVGPINVQYAVKEGTVFVIEANPRASRTVPFVAKATGVPLAMVAARVMTGTSLAALRDEGLLRPPAAGSWVSVKEAVLPFGRFPGVDTLLGPEMRSTGEVMGIGATFGIAFAKSQIAAGTRLPEGGTVFFSLADRDKAAGLEAARAFHELGFTLAATSGTAAFLESNGVPVATVVAKVGESGAADAVELIAEGRVQLVVNTPRGRGPRADGLHIRAAAVVHQVPCLTTVAAARAAAAGIADWRRLGLSVACLQEIHADGPGARDGVGR
ncbi:MAG TPA: carbamoyl-phosphate synthase large subunit, partial [Acidimicrobiales bacterium]|nr:carbamoyl-phosphate synthase large subunit [Acidimicrobiales bacterium]